jgi:LuxR family maltose regulon positive regulatory protein
VALETTTALATHPRRHPAPAARTRRLPAAALVPRTRLVRRLVAGATAPIVLIVAPAGYGKTALLSEWAARDERPFSATSLAVEDAAAVVTRLLEPATRSRGPQVIVVDDAQRAPAAAIRSMLDAASRLPRGTTLAVASRVCPDGVVGRLRAHRLVIELTATDLALTRLEAALLLDAAGVRLDGAQLDCLLARTEGWAAALYLAAVSVRRAADADQAIAGFSGGDRAIADFLCDELLDGLTAGQRTFLRRTSILSRLTPGACDAVLQARGSGAVLASLARGGVPIEPLDRCELAFRSHPLLADTLRAELARLEPELIDPLHRRAAQWHATQREPAEALRHAVVCRDAALGGRMLWSSAISLAAEGRTAALGEWLASFDERSLAVEPTLALSAAVHQLGAGRRGAAARATDAAERALGTDRHAAVALLRACIARDGLPRMVDDAARARTLLTPDSAWHGLALLLLGVAGHLRGDGPAAGALLEDAASHAGGRIPWVAALAHAQLALLAADADDWDEAAHQVAKAHANLPAGDPPAPGALVMAACAVVAAQRGDIAQARHDAGDAERLLAEEPDTAPWLVAEAQTWLARAEIQLSDGPAARRLLARAARLQARVPGDRELARWIHEGWARADAFAETATGDGPMLTNAELRVLRLLPSHMSFREIGERLHVSTNTVKTQALAVYRKLDVSCRSDAVARGRNAGLVGGP